MVNIARSIAPEADKTTYLLLAALAMQHSGHVATIEAVTARARYLASRAGTALTFELCETAMKEVDPNFDFPSRETVATTPRGQVNGSADANFSRTRTVKATTRRFARH